MDDSLRLLRNQDEIDSAIFKKIFYQENVRKETLSKVYDARINLNMESICRLNAKFEEKFKAYKNEGYVITCFMKTNDNKSYEISTWRDIESFDFNSIYAVTEKITLKWIFNLKFPDAEIPITHTLTLNISNGMKPEEMFKLLFSGSIDNNDDIEIAPYPIYAIAEFSDRTLADELLDIISKWVDDFDTTKSELIAPIVWLKKRRQIVSLTVKKLTSIFLHGLAFWLFYKSLMSSDKFDIEYFKNVTTFFSLFVLIVINCERLSTRLGGILFENLSDYGKSHSFSLTSGDEKINIKKKNDAKKIMFKLLFWCIMTVISIIATFFIERFLTYLIS